MGDTTIPDFNPEYKDAVFRDIFKDKARMLSLYNAVNGSSYSDVSQMADTTIDRVLYIGMRNDRSFIFKSEMNLYEHQSTSNPNMPLRGLMYFARLYDADLKRRKKSLFSSTLIKIPAPRFYVFYNGQKDEPDMVKLRLSDAFEIPSDKGGDFEWTATMLNINIGHNRELLERCEPLRAYSLFVAKARELLATGIAKEEAFDRAVDWAAGEKLLGGYFKEKKAEVIQMTLNEWSVDEFKEAMLEDGIEQGAAQKMREMVVNLTQIGVSEEAIAKAAGISVDEVRRIVEEESVTA